VTWCGGPFLGSGTAMDRECSPTNKKDRRYHHANFRDRRSGGLRPGQRILIGPDDVRTVAAPTEREQDGGVSIHTTGMEFLAHLLCPVKVVE
jgi:hypothetical protein